MPGTMTEIDTSLKQLSSCSRSMGHDAAKILIKRCQTDIIIQCIQGKLTTGNTLSAESQLQSKRLRCGQVTLSERLMIDCLRSFCLVKSRVAVLNCEYLHLYSQGIQ